MLQILLCVQSSFWGYCWVSVPWYPNVPKEAAFTCVSIMQQNTHALWRTQSWVGGQLGPLLACNPGQVTLCARTRQETIVVCPSSFLATNPSSFSDMPQCFYDTSAPLMYFFFLFPINNLGALPPAPRYYACCGRPRKGRSDAGRPLGFHFTCWMAPLSGLPPYRGEEHPVSP